MPVAKLTGTSGKQGTREYKAYLKGQTLSRKQSMLAKCFECMGHYDDGRADCEIIGCPLYPFMPYAAAEYKYHAKTGRQLTPEDKKRLSDARKGK